MMSADDMADDAAVTRCEADHTERHDSCQHCDVRAARQHCFECGAGWEDGDRYETGCNEDPGHMHVLVSDWDDEITCPVIELKARRNKRGACGDPITTPGATRCTFHEREANAIEADRIYRNLVAVQ